MVPAFLCSQYSKVPIWETEEKPKPKVFLVSKYVSFYLSMTSAMRCLQTKECFVITSQIPIRNCHFVEKKKYSIKSFLETHKITVKRKTSKTQNLKRF